MVKRFEESSSAMCIASFREFLNVWLLSFNLFSKKKIASLWEHIFLGRFLIETHAISAFDNNIF